MTKVTKVPLRPSFDFILFHFNFSSAREASAPVYISGLLAGPCRVALGTRTCLCAPKRCTQDVYGADTPHRALGARRLSVTHHILICHHPNGQLSKHVGLVGTGSYSLQRCSHQLSDLLWPLISMACTSRACLLCAWVCISVERRVQGRPVGRTGSAGRSVSPQN